MSAYSPEQLFFAQYALALACGKSHQALSKNRQQWFCFLFQTLKIEADLRGLPSPAPPLHAGSLPHAISL